MNKAESLSNCVIVGIGGAGKNVLLQMGYTEGITRVHINCDHKSVREFDGELSVLADRRRALTADTLEPSITALLREQAKPNARFAVVVGGRSPATARLLQQVCRFLHELSCPYRAVLFKPFSFEDQSSFFRTLEVLASLQESLRPFWKTIDLQRQLELMDDAASLPDVLYRANRLAIEMAAGLPAGQGGILAALSSKVLSLTSNPLLETPLLCQIEQVRIEPYDGSGLTRSDGYCVEGTLATPTMANVRFSMSGMCHLKNGLSRDEADTWYQVLAESSTRGEAMILLTSNLFHRDGLRFIGDPIFVRTGYALEDLEVLVSDQTPTPDLYQMLPHEESLKKPPLR
ncbi:hypothetical protein F6455_01045 [Proteobacteria bacterium 005FR1]|nr:hypothetical protein [Proteobacteria bacterium 005FR1]